MDLTDLDLNLLVVFDAVLRTRSVTQAGESLGLSQPALSFALGKLRKFFNDPLFVRTSGGMQPTPLALSITGPVRQVLGIVRTQVLQPPQFEPGATTRTFTFSMSDIGEMAFLPGILGRLKALAPAANVRTVALRPAQLAAALESGEVDLALGYFPDLTKAGLYQQRLFQHSFVCIVRADHPDIRDHISMEQFVRASHVVVSPEGRSHELFEKDLEEKGVKRRVLLSLPHYTSIPTIITSTDLVATVPHPVAAFVAKLPNIRVLPPPMPTPAFEIRQHWHARFQSDPAHKWIRGVVEGLFGQDRYQSAQPPLLA